MDNNSEELLNTFLERGFLPGFNGVTRPKNTTAEGGSCIDNIYSKFQSYSYKNCKYNVEMPDHYSLFSVIDSNSFKNEESNYYKKINYNKLTKLSNSENWNLILKMQDPNLAIDFLINKIQGLVEKSVDKKMFNKSKGRKSWITSGIIVSTQTKEILYYLVKNNPNIDSLKLQYKNYVNVLKSHKMCKK